MNFGVQSANLNGGISVPHLKELDIKEAWLKKKTFLQDFYLDGCKDWRGCRELSLSEELCENYAKKVGKSFVCIKDGHWVSIDWNAPVKGEITVLQDLYTSDEIENMMRSELETFFKER